MKRQSILVLAMAAVLIATPTTFADLTDGLAAYWKFDEGQDNIANDSIGENPGIIYGASWTTAGAVGAALEFDGVGDYVAIPNNSSQQMTMNQITLSALIKLNADVGNTQARIICKQALVPHNDLAWGLEIFGTAYGGSTGNQLNFHDSDGSTWYNSLSPTHLNLFQWYHVAVTDNAGLITMYVDGQEDYSSGSGLGIPSAIDAPIHIGVTNPSNRYFFNGTIDEVRIYNRVETSAKQTQSNPISKSHLPPNLSTSRNYRSRHSAKRLSYRQILSLPARAWQGPRCRLAGETRLYIRAQQRHCQGQDCR